MILGLEKLKALIRRSYRVSVAPGVAIRSDAQEMCRVKE